MVNIGCINRVDTCTSVAIRVVTSSSARSEKGYNSRTNCNKNSDKKLFKCFVIHILKFF